MLITFLDKLTDEETLSNEECGENQVVFEEETLLHTEELEITWKPNNYAKFALMLDEEDYDADDETLDNNESYNNDESLDKNVLSKNRRGNNQNR